MSQSPDDAQWTVKVDQPILLRISSDVTDELHVRSVPDHEVEVSAAPN
jgi:hypothetical protein